MLRIPERVHSQEEMAGVLRQIPNVNSVVLLVEDAEGVFLMTIHGTTAERINWMLDRAKVLLHRAD